MKNNFFNNLKLVLSLGLIGGLITAATTISLKYFFGMDTTYIGGGIATFVIISIFTIYNIFIDKRHNNNPNKNDT